MDRVEIVVRVEGDAIGASASSGDGDVGRLVGHLRADDVRGRHAWSGLEDHWVAGSQAPELYRDLYAAAGAEWVERGYLDHYVVIPARASVLHAWLALAFAHQQVHAARPTRAEPYETEMLSIRRGGAGDLEDALSLADIVWRHQQEAPVWSGVALPDKDERRADWAELLADDAFAYFMAERAGELLGHLVLERRDATTIELVHAATRADARGEGIGVALTEYALHWAHERGYSTCVTDWRAANLLASRFWPRRGFKPTAYRLMRCVAKPAPARLLVAESTVR